MSMNSFAEAAQSVELADFKINYPLRKMSFPCSSLQPPHPQYAFVFWVLFFCPLWLGLGTLCSEGRNIDQ